MRTFVILVSCLALTTLGYAQGQGNPPQKKKKSAESEETAQQPQGPKTQGPSRGGPQRYSPPTQGHHNAGIGQGFGRGSQATPRKLGGPDTRGTTKHATTSGRAVRTNKQGTTATTRTFTPRHFNLATKSRPTGAAPAVTFRQGTRIAGSQNWTGTRYTVFRNYSPVWHDRGWWHSHYDRVVFVFGGWYYWNAGYWYPAWGYAPNSYYAYDGPIYAYNDLPPDQVIANVQASLQEQGYYQGEVDGLLGPLTRAAIARYQEDHGLYITSAIDEPTLASLGMV
jgi:hypothetical protein